MTDVLPGGASLKKPRKGGKQPYVILRFTSYVRLKNPKDGELCLARMKSGETLMEVRSSSDVQIDD